jgi:hypothetical protein
MAVKGRRRLVRMGEGEDRKMSVLSGLMDSHLSCGEMGSGWS